MNLRSLVLLCLFLPFESFGQNADWEAHQWVDSVYNSLDSRARLGQLFMIRAHSDKGVDYEKRVGDLIRKYKVGSVCFFQGTAKRQAELTNEYQQISKQVPLLVAMDAEWGIGMRLKSSTVSFPRQLTLGAIQDNDLIYEMGKEIGAQLRRMGVHINFAPVADINNNAANPVIHTRSFGEDKYNVAVKSYLYAKGLEESEVMACVKHFPGHGDTDVDSHHDLPVIAHNKQRLDSIELYPFKALIDKGISSIMVAHLQVPALEKEENRPTTLSKNTITGLLRNELNFDGLIFTDALEMKGVTKHFPPGKVEAEALMAGNDILVLPENIEAAFREIENYIATGKIPMEQVEASVKRILYAKFKYGLTSFSPISLDGLDSYLNRPEVISMKEKLISEAITLVRNKDNFLPVQKVQNAEFASLTIGEKHMSSFTKRLNSYADFKHFVYSTEDRNSLMRALSDNEMVVVSIFGIRGSAATNFGISKEVISFLNELNKKTKVVVTVFGTPYSLALFDEMDWLIAGYEEDPINQDMAAQAIFGSIAFMGRLPITASSESLFNQGVFTKKLYRIGFSLPESQKINPEKIQKIGNIVNEGIQLKAFPGAVVLVARKGKVVYHEAFGNHIYGSKKAVNKNDIYDLASITKIAAATLAVMKLDEMGLVDIDTRLDHYFPELIDTEKAELTLRALMTHTAGLKSWIPFYKSTVFRDKKEYFPSESYYKKDKTDLFQVEVAGRLFLRNDFADSVKLEVLCSPLRSSNQFLYSDLGFIMIGELVWRLTGKGLDEFVNQQIYKPLQINQIGFNPLAWAEERKIVPSEEDQYFRKQQLRGHVHDMTAALLGGVSGHAGLFSNAMDLGVIMQMLLQGGTYGGVKIFDRATVSKYTARQAVSGARGIGFDMRDLETYGHTGFTGTMVWADPIHELVVVFLSNRTYPSMRNAAINKYGIRKRVLDAVYESLYPEEERFWARIN
jgi:beta-N-acetylhexosaminidase